MEHLAHSCFAFENYCSLFFSENANFQWNFTPEINFFNESYFSTFRFKFDMCMRKIRKLKMRKNKIRKFQTILISLRNICDKSKFTILVFSSSKIHIIWNRYPFPFRFPSSKCFLGQPRIVLWLIETEKKNAKLK